MQYKISIILICQFFLRLFSTTVYAQPIDLAHEGWRFQKGDDPQWATTQYLAEKWQPIAVGMTWEAATKSEYDGIVWYRRSVVIPKSYKKAARKYGSMLLKLGMIDDADETFFNGVKIGSMGKFPPESLSAYGTPREYTVPINLIKWDEPNIIAVRVADWGGGGGLHGGEYSLEPTTWKNRFKILVENQEATHTFLPQNKVCIAPKLINTSDQILEGTVVCEVKTYGGKSVATQKKAVKILRGRTEAVPAFEFNVPDSGFYHSNIVFKDKTGYSFKEKHAFSVAPEAVKPSPTRPADFEDYWAKAIAELSNIDPNYQMTHLADKSTPEVDVFEIEMRSLGNARVRGFYCKPKKKTGLPAVLHVQGYSSNMTAFDIDPNVAGFFLNIRGHGNSMDDINPGFPGYILSGLEDKESYIYRGAYMDCLRAMDFLVSRSEVDTTRLAVEGGSQGGALSIATAALDKRIKLCLPDVPFLSNFRLYFDIASWPANEFKFHMLKTGKSWQNIYSVLDYIDVTNLAPNITCPVIMGVGLYDDICPPAINFSAYNNLSSTDKSYILYPQSGHALPEEHYNVKKDWLYKRFNIQK
jgi:cephalosporin-C deacetylase